MGIFPSLESVQDIDSAPIGVKFTTLEYTLDSFLQKLCDPNFGAHQIESEIRANYFRYVDLDNFKKPQTKSAIKKIWCNERFLKGLLSILNNETLQLLKLDIITFNTIVYDIISLDPPESIKRLILQISAHMNIDVIVPLRAIMDDFSANMVAICARSSLDNERLKVERLNFSMIHLCNRESFTIENIIYVYSKFYLEDFSTLFLYTVINEITISEKEKNIHDKICLAVLYILDSMTSVEITKVLKRYISYLQLYGLPKKKSIWIHFKTLPKGKFDRILKIIEDLETNYEIKFP